MIVVVDMQESRVDIGKEQAAGPVPGEFDIAVEQVVSPEAVDAKEHGSEMWV